MSRSTPVAKKTASKATKAPTKKAEPTPSLPEVTVKRIEAPSYIVTVPGELMMSRAGLAAVRRDYAGEPLRKYLDSSSIQWRISRGDQVGDGLAAPIETGGVTSVVATAPCGDTATMHPLVAIELGKILIHMGESILAEQREGSTL